MSKPDVSEQAKTRLSKARTQLLLNKKYTFWATIGFFQELVEVTSLQRGGVEFGIPTMATDGDHLYYNPEFINSLTNEELMFVLAHEAGHCALMHHLRRGDRHVFGWNVAADFALNLLLVDSGLTNYPKNLLLDKQFAGMSTEQIYAKIPIKKQTGQGQGKDGKDGGDQDGQDFGGCGSVIDSLHVHDEENGEKKWEIRVRTAAQIAKGQGSLPGQFEYLIKPIEPKLDLNTIMRHMFSVVQEDDYSWARPNRRLVHTGLYLPSLRTESLGDIVVGIDTSGSISHEMAAKFIGAVKLILTEIKPRMLHLIQLDAAISEYKQYPKGEGLPNEVGIKGCGGTDMRPIWEFIKERAIEPSVAIVCSDFEMDTASFGKKQEFPVLWATTEKGVKAPWGLAVQME